MQGLDSELRSVMTTAGVISRRSAWLVAGAATCLVLAFLARDEVQRISLVVSGLALAAAAGGVRVIAMLDA